MLIRFDLQNYFRHAEFEIVPNKHQLVSNSLTDIYPEHLQVYFHQKWDPNKVLIFITDFNDDFTDMSKDDFFLLGENGSGQVKIALGCEPLD